MIIMIIVKISAWGHSSRSHNCLSCAVNNNSFVRAAFPPKTSTHTRPTMRTFHLFAAQGIVAPTLNVHYLDMGSHVKKVGKPSYSISDCFTCLCIARHF